MVKMGKVKIDRVVSVKLRVVRWEMMKLGEGIYAN